MSKSKGVSLERQYCYGAVTCDKQILKMKKIFAFLPSKCQAIQDLN